MQPFETIEVDTSVVACDGGTEGHPKVYLNLTRDGAVECPYCSRLFVRRGAGAPGFQGTPPAGAVENP